VSENFLGDQPSARCHIEHMLAHYVPLTRKHEIIRFHFDPRAAARAVLARVLWLQGFPDQAMRTAEDIIEDALAANHVTTLCRALALTACPIALWTGDLTAAESHYCSIIRHGMRWRSGTPLAVAFREFSA
jgi:hypothetical protein